MVERVNEGKGSVNIGELIENMGFLARFLFSSSEKLLSFFTISKKVKIIIKEKNI